MSPGLNRLFRQPGPAMSSPSDTTKAPSQFAQVLPWLGLGLTAVFSLVPLLVEPLGARKPLRFEFVPPHTSNWISWGSMVAVALAMLLSLLLCAWANRRSEPRMSWLIGFGIVTAGLMTACHWIVLDSIPFKARWQGQMYLDILNHCREAPHQFRPLPYGFTRYLEWVTGNWTFSFLAYRWFFTFWFLWGCYRFARLWHPPGRSLLTLVPVVLLYPLSIWYYWGQLTDPLSHALFVMALTWIVKDRWLLLAMSLGLGVLAKETVVLMVPAYLACWWCRGWPAFLKALGLSAVCVAVFLAARLPYGWWPGFKQINDTDRWMIWDNLGLGEQYYNHIAPLYVHYLHLALFILIFVPFIALGWRHLDGRLKALCLTLTPLLLLSNLLFGWVYESRNYMPLVPLLATSALFSFRPIKGPAP